MDLFVERDSIRFIQMKVAVDDGDRDDTSERFLSIKKLIYLLNLLCLAAVAFLHSPRLQQD